MSFHRFNVLTSTALLAVFLSGHPALSQPAPSETTAEEAVPLSPKELALLAKKAHEAAKHGKTLDHHHVRGPSASVVKSSVKGSAHHVPAHQPVAAPVAPAPHAHIVTPAPSTTTAAPAPSATPRALAPAPSRHLGGYEDSSSSFGGSSSSSSFEGSDSSSSFERSASSSSFGDGDAGGDEHRDMKRQGSFHAGDHHDIDHMRAGDPEHMGRADSTESIRSQSRTSLTESRANSELFLEDSSSAKGPVAPPSVPQRENLIPQEIAERLKVEKDAEEANRKALLDGDHSSKSSEPVEPLENHITPQAGGGVTKKARAKAAAAAAVPGDHLEGDLASQSSGDFVSGGGQRETLGNTVTAAQQAAAEAGFRQVRQEYDNKLAEVRRKVSSSGVSFKETAEAISGLRKFASDNQQKLAGWVPAALQGVANMATWSTTHNPDAVKKELEQEARNTGFLSLDHADEVAKGGNTPKIYAKHANALIQESKHDPKKYQEIVELMDNHPLALQQEVHQKLVEIFKNDESTIKNKKAGLFFGTSGDADLKTIQGHLDAARTRIANKHFAENPHQVVKHTPVEFTAQAPTKMTLAEAKDEASKLVEAAGKNTDGHPWRWAQTYSSLKKDVFDVKTVDPLVKAQVAEMVKSGYAAISQSTAKGTAGGAYSQGVIYKGSTRASSDQLADTDHKDLLASVGVDIDSKQVMPAIVQAANKVIEDHHAALQDHQESAKAHEKTSVKALEAAHGHLLSAKEKVDEYHAFVSGSGDPHAAEMKALVEGHMKLASTQGVTHTDLKNSAEKIRQFGEEKNIPHALIFADQADHHADAKEQHTQAVATHDAAGKAVEDHARTAQADHQIQGLTHVKVEHTPPAHEIHQPVVHEVHQPTM